MLRLALRGRRDHDVVVDEAGRPLQFFRPTRRTAQRPRWRITSSRDCSMDLTVPYEKTGGSHLYDPYVTVRSVRYWTIRATWCATGPSYRRSMEESRECKIST